MTTWHCRDCKIRLMHEAPDWIYGRCPACNRRYKTTFSTTLALDEWVAQFPGIKEKTAHLWKNIRWEFEQQRFESMTVRQMFYRMSTGSFVEKTEEGYRRVQRCLLQMRRAQAIPYRLLTDGTRYVHKKESFSGMEHAMNSWQVNYRRSLWDTQPVYIELWVEKDALAGIFRPITEEFDVPLYVARGFASETYIQTAAEQIKEIGKLTYVYHFGDYDPSGRGAAEHIARQMREFGAQFEFIEAAVTEQQIFEMQLPTRPTKDSDSRTPKWKAAGKGDSVELDAIPPQELRRMVRAVIEQHIDHEQLAIVRTIEQQERQRFAELANGFN